ncbi:MAG: sialate O-acetylesterase, partial [Verrucomicrobiaceae bacterium]|nr:sialate O-acetylesterase [Verrucomicrobiaceae bacterium]
MQRYLLRVAAFSFSLSLNLHAEVSLPSIFGSNMVLQRDHANPVWGWAAKEEKITVSIGDQSHEATAGVNGSWQVTLKPMKATGEPLILSVKGDNELEFKNILVGEVWLCSGQSNMGMSVNRADDADLEIMSAKHPNLRIISIPPIGTQQAQKDFKGQWEAITPANAGDFSAVGYFFGRQVHRSLDVPVGLIDNAWGGSACEAWIRRDLLEKSTAAKPYMKLWSKTEAEHDPAADLAQYEQRLARWKERAKKLRAEKKAVPKPPRKPRTPLTGQHRPANLYNGVLKPIIGYGIRGAIWYQGE